MTTNTLRSLAKASLSLGAICLASCAVGPTVPIAGTALDSKFEKAFFPTLKTGMKWTYVYTSSLAGTNQTNEKTMEITEVQGDFATCLTTTGKDGSTSTQSATCSVSNPASLFIPGGLISDGAQDVTTKYGVYSKAAKVHASSHSGTYYWIVAGKGLVMEQTTMPSLGLMETVLKDFQQP